MGGEPTIDRAGTARLLGWWLDAGVDVATGDEARNWLREGRANPAPVPAAPVQDDKVLEDFAALLALLKEGTGLPLERPGARRILPAGPEAAPLMIVADLPGAVEAAEGRPLAGDSRLLAERMLAAIGLTSEQVLVSPLACFASEGARAKPAELAECGKLAREQIRLAKPARVLLFGDASARALTGHPLSRARGRIHQLEGVRAVATFHPRWLLQRPSDKALAWRDLQLLMSDDE